MIEFSGKKECQLVLIHGGPGAIGSLHILAQQLGKSIGVAEHIQTKYTIEDLIEELKQDISPLNHKVTLLGHSWGAWLAGLFAKRYPELVENVILVGCPPLAERYVSMIEERRYQRFTLEEKEQFQTLLKKLGDPADENKDAALYYLGSLVEKADNYCLNSKLICEGKTDGSMYDAIWQEASQWRQEGKWEKIFTKINCPVYLIQGKYDPHPIEGVTEPLEKFGKIKKIYEMPKSGHSPFSELYDSPSFCELVIRLSEPLHKNGK
ncbi:MAG: alpha/beta hydrolase [Beduini sp.]|uniref:alpha/beta hydrolase n=1 Tax=Beduini sp. TaxID=1922300 RepID=UPI00399FDF91